MSGLHVTWQCSACDEVVTGSGTCQACGYRLDAAARRWVADGRPLSEFQRPPAYLPPSRGLTAARAATLVVAFVIALLPLPGVLLTSSYPGPHLPPSPGQPCTATPCSASPDSRLGAISVRGWVGRTPSLPLAGAGPVTYVLLTGVPSTRLQGFVGETAVELEQTRPHGWRVVLRPADGEERVTGLLARDLEDGSRVLGLPGVVPDVWELRADGAVWSGPDQRSVELLGSFLRLDALPAGAVLLVLGTAAAAGWMTGSRAVAGFLVAQAAAVLGAVLLAALLAPLARQPLSHWATDPVASSGTAALLVAAGPAAVLVGAVAVRRAVTGMLADDRRGALLLDPRVARGAAALLVPLLLVTVVVVGDLALGLSAPGAHA